MALKMGKTIHSSLLQERINKLKTLLENFEFDTKNILIGSLLVSLNEITRDIIIFCSKQTYKVDMMLSSKAFLKQV